MSSRLDYCNAVLAGSNKSVMRSLQLIQNAAARLVTRSKKREHITPVLRNLHWLPIPDRITFKVAITVFKYFNNPHTAPSYLHLPSVNTLSGRRSLRSASRNDLLVPRSLSATYGQKSFFVVGPKIWNSLPLVLRLTPTLASFKSQLKTYLFNN